CASFCSASCCCSISICFCCCVIASCNDLIWSEILAVGSGDGLVAGGLLWPSMRLAINITKNTGRSNFIGYLSSACCWSSLVFYRLLQFCYVTLRCPGAVPGAHSTALAPCAAILLAFSSGINKKLSCARPRAGPALELELLAGTLLLL